MNLTGIAILPDRAFADALIEFQSRHRDTVHGPVLGHERNLPHVSILQCPYTDALPARSVVAELATMARTADYRLDVQAIRYQPVGWLFLDVTRNHWLDALQHHALGLTEDFIERDAVDLTKDMSGYAEAERDNYLRYGYRYVGDAFQPHFTLGRIDPPAFDEGALNDSFKEFLADSSVAEPLARRLVVYRAGEHGALVEVLAEEHLR